MKKIATYSILFLAVITFCGNAIANDC